jgi:PAS domain S-box-containing protein
MSVSLVSSTNMPWTGWFNRDLIENMPVGVYVCDADGVLVAYNKRAAALWGRTPVLGDTQQKYCGAHRLHLADGTYVPHDQTPLALVLRTQQPYAFEAMVGRPDGTLRNVSANVAPLFNDEGVFVGFVNCVLDITEVKAQAEALRAAEDALRQSQKMEAIGLLTGGVAHDFNNLLTVIRGSVDVLKIPGLSDERRARFLAAISDTTDRGAKLTNQLLAFARRQTLKVEVFDVSDNIVAIQDMIGTLTGARIKIDLKTAGEHCLANTDSGQLDTAVVNMVVNARDAMAGRGTITISIEPASTIPAIRSHGPRTGDFVKLSVSDTGSGIAAENLERVFEPFFTTKGLGQGTGLGLSQVFGFTKQSGGEVMVESRLGEGTTFTLYLPRFMGEKAPGSGASAAQTSTLGDGVTVLIVEDNLEVGEFTNATLEELGFTTVLVTNAAAALAELGKDASRFDIVFTDVEMPGMNGLQLAREITRRHAGLPVVLTSGYSHSLSQEGSDGFELVPKPYSIERLTDTLQRHIGQRARV